MSGAISLTLAMLITVDMRNVTIVAMVMLPMMVLPNDGKTCFVTKHFDSTG